MTPLDGIRVVEVAQYALVPGAAAIMADWGAEVIKVEHPTRGDAIRGLTAWDIPPGTGGFTYLHEILNRGKRSIGIDLAEPAGREALLDLVRHADVFLTNFLPAARHRLGIDVDDIRAANPTIIYGRGSAYGPLGDDADRGGFDGISYWHRVGLGRAVTPPGAEDVTPMPGPAFGDVQGALALAAGVMAALLQRERDGSTTVVDTSLLAVGAWAMQASLVGANVSGWEELPKYDPPAVRSPLSTTYPTADGHLIALAILEGDKHWARLCEAVGRADLADDERFTTSSARAAHADACAHELRAAFASKSLADWEAILGRQEGQWEVVRRVGDLNGDAQAWANGYLRSVDYDDGRCLTMVAAPVQFDASTPDLRPAPELGADTEMLLLATGRTWDDIAELKAGHVIT